MTVTYPLLDDPIPVLPEENIWEALMDPELSEDDSEDFNVQCVSIYGVFFHRR